MNDMSFEEKSVWLNALITLGAVVGYVVTVLVRARDIALADVAYISPMLWAIGWSIVVTIVTHILMACIWPKEADKKDVRDQEINRHGEYAGQVFLVIGGLCAMVLAMLKVDHFWIANSVYICFALSNLFSSAFKIFAYRKGIPLC